LVSTNNQINLGVKTPRWMLDSIREVQGHLQQERPEQTVTRTDAVRHILGKGLEALGFDLQSIKNETKEAKTE